MKLPAPVLIFVKPQASGNVGAIARVMSNFGISELRLVNEPVSDNEAFDAMGKHDKIDWIMACRGQAVLEAKKVYDTFEHALEGIHLAIASTGRLRDSDTGYSRPHHSIQEALEQALDFKTQLGSETNFKWALVIGPENDGLSEIDVSRCRCVVNIPTSEINPSMNAAMATGCLLYHWHVFSNSEDWPTRENRGAFLVKNDYSEAGRNDWATSDQMEKFCQYLMGTIEMTDFVKYPDKKAVLARMRRWTQNAPIPVGELLFAFELLYHLKAKISGSFPQRGFLD